MRIQIATLTFACLLTASSAMAQVINSPPNGRVRPPVPDGKLGMALLSAVVAADGTLTTGAGATGVNHAGIGVYFIGFNRDLTGCTLSATVGEPAGPGGGNVIGVTSVAGQGGDGTGVFVQTLDPPGTNVDRPFHLLVFCTR